MGPITGGEGRCELGKLEKRAGNRRRRGTGRGPRFPAAGTVTEIKSPGVSGTGLDDRGGAPDFYPASYHYCWYYCYCPLHSRTHGIGLFRLHSMALVIAGP